MTADDDLLNTEENVLGGEHLDDAGTRIGAQAIIIRVELEGRDPADPDVLPASIQISYARRAAVRRSPFADDCIPRPFPEASVACQGEGCEGAAL